MPKTRAYPGKKRLDQRETNRSASPRSGFEGPIGEHLRNSFTEVLEVLGQGFLEHPENRDLRRALKRGELSPQGYFNQLLRLVYRLIFLLAVEERDLLHPDGTSARSRQLYAKKYALGRLSERALDRNASEGASDLWETLKVAFHGLATGAPRLALPALAGIFARDQCPALDLTSDGKGAKLENRCLLQVVRRLSWIEEAEGPVRVNWCNLAPEDLGSVYETVLERTPEIVDDGRSFRFADARSAAHARRLSGSYYTPDSLVRTLLDRALQPVIDETLARCPNDAARALLDLTVVDPACGSGHFLLAAGRRLALHVARAAVGRAPSPIELRHALRQVVGRCLYGVDLNPLAVELCKVSLWLEALEPGRPLSFLDSHVRCGNALLGATAERVIGGIPDAAWQPSAEDDRKVARSLRKQNRLEQQRHAFDSITPRALLAAPATESVLAVEATDDATLPEIEQKARQWTKFLESGALGQASTVANLWCAAFFWSRQAGALGDVAPTHALLQAANAETSSLPEPLLDEVARLAREHRFFHWDLAFPQVFARGGFDVALGNPPWIAHAGRAAQPLSAGMRRFCKANYPTFAGYPSTHGMFIGLGANLLKAGGALGFIVPSSVSELPKYRPTRKAHDDLCTFNLPLIDFGEGQFPGVTQPCMALVSRRKAGGRSVGALGSAWPMERPDLNEVARSVLAQLERFAPLPRELFGERGFQSDASTQEHFREIPEPKGRFTLPLREGTDVREFRLLPPRVHADPKALRGKLRSNEEFRAVRIVLRNTARYPIAALSDGSAFRNSLLAGFDSEQWPAAALVAYLNSALVRWQHYVRHRDARQPILPQVKIGHLRAIPAPRLTPKTRNLLLQLGSHLSRSKGAIGEKEWGALDALVFDAFDVSAAGRDLILSWHREIQTRARKRADKNRPPTG